MKQYEKYNDKVHVQDFFLHFVAKCIMVTKYNISLLRVIFTKNEKKIYIFLLCKSIHIKSNAYILQ